MRYVSRTGSGGIRCWHYGGYARVGEKSNCSAGRVESRTMTSIARQPEKTFMLNPIAISVNCGPGQSRPIHLYLFKAARKL